MKRAAALTALANSTRVNSLVTTGSAPSSSNVRSSAWSASSGKYARTTALVSA